MEKGALDQRAGEKAAPRIPERLSEPEGSKRDSRSGEGQECQQHSSKVLIYFFFLVDHRAWEAGL